MAPLLLFASVSSELYLYTLALAGIPILFSLDPLLGKCHVIVA